MIFYAPQFFFYYFFCSQQPRKANYLLKFCNFLQRITFIYLNCLDKLLKIYLLSFFQELPIETKVLFQKKTQRTFLPLLKIARKSLPNFCSLRITTNQSVRFQVKKQNLLLFSSLENTVMCKISKKILVFFCDVVKSVRQSHCIG